MKPEKTYWLWGTKIERHPHYVNAYQHYEYKTMNKTFASLEEAKNYIRESLGIKTTRRRK